MKMDGDDENLSEFNSFLINQEIHANIIELSKKRKLQGDQLGLPLPKHRFGDKSSGSEQQEQVSFTCILKENTDDGGFSDPGPEHLESSNDSNCFNSATYLYPEVKSEPEFLKIYSYKQSATYEAEYPKAHIRDLPSTSSGSCGSNTITHCLDSMSTEKSTSKEEEDSPSMDSEPNPATLKDGLKFEEEDQHPDNICSETGATEIEQYSDMEDNEIMIYSNEAPSNNIYVLSSGRWNTTKQDAQVQVKKPTIDQEFEQYFSMLML